MHRGSTRTYGAPLARSATPYGDSLDRHCLRAWNGDFVRLLDDRLSRGQRVLSAKDCVRRRWRDHWRRLQNVRALHCHSPRLVAIAGFCP